MYLFLKKAYFLKEAIISCITNGTYCIIFWCIYSSFIQNNVAAMRFIYLFEIYCFSLGKQDIYHHFISNYTLGKISGRLLRVLCMVKKSYKVSYLSNHNFFPLSYCARQLWNMKALWYGYFWKKNLFEMRIFFFLGKFFFRTSWWLKLGCANTKRKISK